MMTSLRKAGLLLFIFPALIAPAAFSQAKAGGEAPSACELVRTRLDEALAETARLAEGRTIFIFRLGRDENSRKLIGRRMTMVRNHIQFRNQNPDRFILAEAEKTKGPGKLEIYIAGRLKSVLYAGRNGNFGDDCAEEF